MAILFHKGKELNPAFTGRQAPETLRSHSFPLLCHSGYAKAKKTAYSPKEVGLSGVEPESSLYKCAALTLEL